jgi:small subunit ribosomal protein S15e
MADVQNPVDLAEKQKARAFRKFTYRGVELEKLLDMPTADVVKMFNARQRRKFARGIKRQPMTLIKKLTKAKKECAYGEKPAAVKTHMRDMIIVPEMIGSIVGVYNGKQFINVEIKPDLVGFYLGEFAITYKPVKHGRAGALMAASKMVPLK